MRCTVSSFWLPRHGSPAGQYEDAFSPRRTGVRTAPSLRLAVADGASESMLSGLWADLLVTTWCRSRRRGVREVVAAAMSEWHTTLGNYLEGREAERRPIEWFEQPGLDRGAHATLLGLELSQVQGPVGDGCWTAVSLGDSCLFHVSADALVTAFPVDDAAHFGNTPKLVPTGSSQLDRVMACLEWATGTWRPGDVLFLTTDALAAWFLTETGAGAAPWRDLTRIDRDDHAGFAFWAAGLRARGRLRNDDLTLLRVELAEAG